jgi:spore coat protein H
MNRKAFKSSLLIIFIFCTIRLFAFSSDEFPDIRIYIAANQFTKLQKTKGDKLILDGPVMLINNDTAKTKEIHTRGNNSLNFKRKSFSVELDNSIRVTTSGNQEIHLKKFNLLSLSMDKFLWRNRWSNINMNSIGIFPLVNLYCKVWINDQPQGYYLLVEKPQHSRGKLNSPYMLRRGIDHSINDEYYDEKDKIAAKEYRKQFESIYSNIRFMNEQELAAYLQKAVNMDVYSRFLAFNYLMMNGDYSDEVFFYIEPQHQWFEVIPWDFDDILRANPHEGRIARNEEFVDKKIFSMEEKLDRAIAGNAALYTQYERVLKQTLLMLDSATLTQSAQQVINELEQLNQDKSNGAVTLFLDKEPFVMEAARKDVLTSLESVLKRRKWILAELK